MGARRVVRLPAIDTNDDQPYRSLGLESYCVTMGINSSPCCAKYELMARSSTAWLLRNMPFGSSRLYWPLSNMNMLAGP